MRPGRERRQGDERRERGVLKDALIFKYYRFRDRFLPLGTGRRLLLMIFAESVRTGGGKRPIGRLLVLASLLYRFFLHREAAEEALNRTISDRLHGVWAMAPGFFPGPDGGELSFEGCPDPIISIVIPVMDKWAFTLSCLRSILGQGGGIPLEVVVIDNGSSDQTEGALTQMAHIKVRRSEVNLGFVEACNLGVEESAGKYVLFLNNDAVLLPGALGNMLDLMERDASVGLVGAKLLYPDGRLQEAGGIVWNDRVNPAWNYGRYDSPGKWEYNYVKETDYCSGACILVRKDLLGVLGSFDRRFSPAYCEDTDLAFSVRDAGFKVMYQPASEVIHFEGVTAGSDIDKGYKRYQRINTEKFCDKWGDVLKSNHFANGEHVFLARDRSRSRKRMLYIDHMVPTFDKDAGSLITYEYLKIFVSLGLKIVFWPADLIKSEPYTSALQQMGIEVVYGYNNFERYISAAGEYFDYVFLSRPFTAVKFLDKIRKHSAARIFYVAHDLHFLREGRRAGIEKNRRLMAYAGKLKRIEMDILEKSDMSFLFSPVEQDMLRQENPALHTGIMPWIQRLHGSERGFEERKNIMFLGSFAHKPNQDGLKWFVPGVLDDIKTVVEDLTLVVVGSNPTEEIMGLARHDVVIEGYVPDTSARFQGVRVFVAPLRYGAGIKGKILEAMSYGLPVVTTPVGAEGLALRDGVDAMIAVSPGEFAAKVVQLYTSRDLWSGMSENSLKYVRANNSPDRARALFAEILDVGREP
jgi:O-antigen biosynthesis protein